MRKKLVPSIVAALALTLSVSPGALAEDRGPAQIDPPKPMVPLKLDLVISRHAGEKKISSMPYSLWLTANAPDRGTSLRMGVQVPVPTVLVSASKEGERTETPSYSYRDVGTNIDCSATSAGDRFSVAITLNDSGVHFDPKDPARPNVGAPSFRNFTSRFYLLLKDGQRATYTSATDPVTGETLRVDVTLNVLK